jgi:hypothetical protein
MWVQGIDTSSLAAGAAANLRQVFQVSRTSSLTRPAAKEVFRCWSPER